MTDAKASLDSLRIDRNRKAPSRGLGPWIIALTVVLLLSGAGAAASMGVLFALFGIWQLEPMVRLNRPRAFTPDDPPSELMP